MDSKAHASEDAGLTQPAVAHDLKAAVQARRELGGDLEDPVLEAFLARIEGQISQQVRQEVAAQTKQSSVSASDLKEFALGSMGIAIPLLAAAGIFGGLPGIVAVAVAIVVINIGYFAAVSR